MVNVPMPARSKGMDVREAVDMMWLPRLHAFKPEMLFVSAGFDAHREDDLGNLGLVEDDYAWLTDQVARYRRPLCAWADRELSGRRVQPVGAWTQRGRSCAGAGRNLSGAAGFLSGVRAVCELRAGDCAAPAAPRPFNLPGFDPRHQFVDHPVAVEVVHRFVIAALREA